MTAVRRVSLAILAVTVPALAACSSSGVDSDPATSGTTGGDARVAHVTITAAKGCVTDRAEFRRRWPDASRSRTRTRPRSARSNCSPASASWPRRRTSPAGLGGEFAVKVGAGTYTLYCPGAATERSTIKVTGKAAPVDDTLAGLLKTATDDYKTYVDHQIGYLVDGAEKLNAALHGSSISPRRRTSTRPRGPTTRRSSRSRSPSSAATQNLDADIDARENDVPASKWSGFHLIEKALFQTREPGRAAEVGRQARRRLQDVAGQGQGRSPTRRPTSPTARRACSTRSPAARSPARRSGTRTSTCSTWPTTSRAPSRRSPTCSRRSTRSTRRSATRSPAQFAALNKVLDGYRSTSRPVRLRAVHDAERRRRPGAGRGGQGGPGTAVEGRGEGGERLSVLVAAGRSSAAPLGAASLAAAGGAGFGIARAADVEHEPAAPVSSRSTARTRPASPRRRRTASPSRRSTSRRPTAPRCRACSRSGRLPRRSSRRGRPIGAVETSPDAPADRHRRGDGPGRGAADRHRRLRPVPVRRPVRVRRPATGRARRPPGAARRRARPGHAATATSACRRARTTRRSRST